jgi:hypothetical protein
MRHVIYILAALIAGSIVTLTAQTLYPFSIQGLGLATSLSQCPAPATNDSILCPVNGSGWMQSINGAAYSSLGSSAGSQFSVKITCPKGTGSVPAGWTAICTLTMQ